MGKRCGVWWLLWPAALMAFSFAPSVRAAAPSPADGSVLPFPPVPQASIAGETLAESKLIPRAVPQHLAKGAPNIVIILLDDVGYGLPDTFGGEIPHADADAPGAKRHQL